MEPPLMNLKVLLPFRVYAEKKCVLRIIAETHCGSFGLLPRRLDCTAALVAGILTYETADEGTVYVAVDAGVLVKTGPEVVISVRNAIGGAELGKLRETVEREFLKLDQHQRSVRSVLAKLESSFVRRFLEFQHG